MSETEQYAQIGRLAEEYSAAKGRLNHVLEKLARCKAAYAYAGQVFDQIKPESGSLAVPPITHFHGQAGDLEALLDFHQMLELLEEKMRLEGEVGELADRLRKLAPHLV